MKGFTPLGMASKSKGAEVAVTECGTRKDSCVSTDEVRVSFIDVGKGDCIIIQAGQAFGLIDTGYTNTAHKTAEYLHKQGVTQLEFVVITHYDRDHIGGLKTLGKAYSIRSLYLPDYAGADKNYQLLSSAIRELGLIPQSVRDTKKLRLENASITISPSGIPYDPKAKGDEGNDNDLSIVAELNHGDDSFLFTGDLESDGIEALLARTPGTFDILKMPRHGQKTPNTDELLDSIHPQVAVITDDEDEPANKKVLKLLAEADVKTYRTSIDGTIMVRCSGSGSYSITCDRG